MTTEIAVINRLGVALATDSAVTISGDRPKVFDTGDKLFELCDNAPIGVMINGNMDLLGVPWEIIIKDFRSTIQVTGLSIQQALQALLDFASTHKAFNDHSERTYVFGVAFDEFEWVKKAVGRAFVQARAEAPPSVQAIVAEKAKERIAEIQATGRAESLSGVTVDQVIKAHKDELNIAIDQRFKPIEIAADTKQVLRRLIAAALLHRETTGFATGVIVAGYGEGEMFPSLAMAEVDGAVCGKLRYSHGDDVKINRSQNPGKVISFAQTDVVERLLSGTDSQFIDKSAEFIQSSISKAKEAVAGAVGELGPAGEGLLSAIDDIATAVAEEYRSNFAKSARAEFEGNFNEMVALMPKRDIIEMAEALVSITAIERKASTEQATVGGPVDVAFITKHEGFVWIKRKQYFDPDLNPRYFWRKFRLANKGESM